MIFSTKPTKKQLQRLKALEIEALEKQAALFDEMAKRYPDAAGIYQEKRQKCVENAERLRNGDENEIFRLNQHL
ncbi:hypothetical protein [Anabaena lutea]|uniref:Uncharacterized protein n=1 Tax=Anabaena lutea FACHB-196 TaxID=2692881 RepID=A0ABR8FMZ4_9NOST|nr:hypothetical protein [Anabaena lutea]MBD2571368.1 hypothetical protein [Anabaena lutea FACHB-196]